MFDIEKMKKEAFAEVLIELKEEHADDPKSLKKIKKIEMENKKEEAQKT